MACTVFVLCEYEAPPMTPSEKIYTICFRHLGTKLPAGLRYKWAKISSTLGLKTFMGGWGLASCTCAASLQLAGSQRALGGALFVPKLRLHQLKEMLRVPLHLFCDRGPRGFLVCRAMIVHPLPLMSWNRSVDFRDEVIPGANMREDITAKMNHFSTAFITQRAPKPKVVFSFLYLSATHTSDEHIPILADFTEILTKFMKL